MTETGMAYKILINLMGSDHFEDTGLKETTILKCILRKEGERM
jgi:hypothetical protein